MDLRSYFTFLRFIAAISLILQLTSGLHIELYDASTPRWLLYENTTEDCTNLPSEEISREIKYAITDSCMLIFASSNCYGFNAKFEAGSSSWPNTDIGFNYFNSFRPCTAHESQSKLNLYLYRGEGEKNLVASYDDVCGCIDLSNNNIRGQISSVAASDCVRTYSDSQCTGSSVDVIGGTHYCSNNLNRCGRSGWKSEIKSLGPCKKPWSCLNLTATIVSMEILDIPTKSQIDAAAHSEPLSAKAKFSNNGSAIVSQEYTARKMVATTNEVEIGKTLSEMNHVGVSASATLSGEVGGLFAKASVSATLSAAYDYERTTTEERRERFSQTTENEFSITERIEIQPCQNYEISSFVNIVENMPLRYSVFAEISGYNGNVRMLASEIESMHLGSMEYIRNINEYTILARETASMTAGFGTETYVYANGNKIKGCNLSG